MGLPAWLAGALARAPRPVDMPPVTGSPVVGDIWLAQTGEHRALVAINMTAESHEDERIVNACFVSTDLDLATSESLTFHLGEPGIPYSLVVHTDVLGPILVSDLVTRVGHLPIDPVVFRYATLLGEFDPDLASRRGVALRGRDDPRWEFIEGCLDRLNPFINHAMDVVGW